MTFRDRIYFSPTVSNILLIGALAKMPRFRQCRFIPLSDDQDERCKQLEKIRGRVAYIWGNGFDHHESYFFTKHRLLRLKANIDHHSDYDAEGSSYPACWDHMYFTSQDGLCVLTPPDSYAVALNLRLLMADLQTQSIYHANGQISITIDCDGFPCFPGAEEFVFRGGTRIDAVSALVTSLGPKLFRLDIGGLVETIPEHWKLPVARKITTPTFEEALSFAQSNGLSQKSITRVWSYAAHVYSEILGAFCTA